MSGVEIAAALTLWTCLAAWFIVPTVNGPAAIARAAMGILCLELLALLVWSYGSEGCTARPCAPAAETARTAAALDLPTLTGVLMAVLLLHGIRIARARR
jgi:hypothetical protein